MNTYASFQVAKQDFIASSIVSLLFKQSWCKLSNRIGTPVLLKHTEKLDLSQTWRYANLPIDVHAIFDGE